MNGGWIERLARWGFYSAIALVGALVLVWAGDAYVRHAPAGLGSEFSDLCNLGASAACLLIALASLFANRRYEWKSRRTIVKRAALIAIPTTWVLWWSVRPRQDDLAFLLSNANSLLFLGWALLFHGFKIRVLAAVVCLVVILYVVSPNPQSYGIHFTIVFSCAGPWALALAFGKSAMDKGRNWNAAAIWLCVYGLLQVPAHIAAYADKRTVGDHVLLGVLACAKFLTLASIGKNEVER